MVKYTKSHGQYNIRKLSNGQVAQIKIRGRFRTLYIVIERIPDTASLNSPQLSIQSFDFLQLRVNSCSFAGEREEGPVLNLKRGRDTW